LRKIKIEEGMTSFLKYISNIESFEITLQDSGEEIVKTYKRLIPKLNHSC